MKPRRTVLGGASTYAFSFQQLKHLFCMVLASLAISTGVSCPHNFARKITTSRVPDCSVFLFALRGSRSCSNRSLQTTKVKDNSVFTNPLPALKVLILHVDLLGDFGCLGGNQFYRRGSFCLPVKVFLRKPLIGGCTHILLVWWVWGERLSRSPHTPR